MNVPVETLCAATLSNLMLVCFICSIQKENWSFLLMLHIKQITDFLTNKCQCLLHLVQQ